MTVRRIALVVFAVFVALVSDRAGALINVKLPVSEMYEGSTNVIVGKITKVSADAGTVEAAATTLRGKGVGEVLRFKFENQPDVLAKAKEGSPLIVFTGRKAANYALHISDTWLLPEAVEGKPGLFAVRNPKDLKQSFPGSTAALLKVVEELKAGKSTMLNSASPDMFKGGVKDLGKVAGAPFSSLTSFKSNGKAYLKATSGGNTMFFQVGASGLEPVNADAVQPPAPASLDKLAGTGDAKSICAWAAGDFGEDATAFAALVLRENSIVRLPDGADFTRLTGEHLETYFRDVAKPFAEARVCTLDCNGDGRTDLLIVTPTRAMLLINRGFGALFINADIGKLLVDGSGKPLITPMARFAGVDVDGDGLDDLVIVSEAGVVTAVMNPKGGK